MITKFVQKSSPIELSELSTLLLAQLRLILIKDRFIGENIRFVLDLIDYCTLFKKSSLLFFLVDFEKAFDTSRILS